MSRGPGRIERAIRALFDEHPDEAFTTDDLCVTSYPDIQRKGARLVGLNERERRPIGGKYFIERKHRVVVVRAAEKIVAGDPDWRSGWSGSRGNMLTYFNAASIPSVAMNRALLGDADMHHDWVLKRTQQTLDGQGKWDVEDRANIERHVSQHIAVRDATDPAEAERLRAEHEAEQAKQLAQRTQRLRALAGGSPAQVLPSESEYRSTTLNALADRARALMAQNDPDAVRAGLREIADALERLATR
jgi:hypothetical protein